PDRRRDRRVSGDGGAEGQDGADRLLHRRRRQRDPRAAISRRGQWNRVPPAALISESHMKLKLSGAAACVFASVVLASTASAQTTQPFDGRPWNISTGNLSTFFIQASPIGSHPRPDVK